VTCIHLLYAWCLATWRLRSGWRRHTRAHFHLRGKRRSGPGSGSRGTRAQGDPRARGGPDGPHLFSRGPARADPRACVPAAQTPEPGNHTIPAN